MDSGSAFGVLRGSVFFFILFSGVFISAGVCEGVFLSILRIVTFSLLCSCLGDTLASGSSMGFSEKIG